MLNIDAAAVSAGKVAHQLFNLGGSVIMVFQKFFRQFYGLPFKTGGGQLLGIFLSLFGVDNFPMSPIKLLGALLHRRLQAFPDGLPHAGNGQQIQGLLDGPPVFFRKSRPR
jgi:hypothetical protein